MVDYHLHSFLCRHGKGEIYEYVESAIQKGLTEIGFAEHIPIPDLDDPTGRMVIDDWDKYLNDVRAAQKQYPEITIRLGIEADYLPEFMPYIQNFLQQYEFDYVIGSVHFVDDWDFSNPALYFRLDEFGVNYLYKRYYELIQEAAASGLYDVIGHLDLPKKVQKQPSVSDVEWINAALLAIKENDLALDVNSSGLRKEAREIYPRAEILQQAHDMGIPVCLGSDAHKPTEVAANFQQSTDLLQQIGYTENAVFKNRQRTFVPLDLYDGE